MLEFSKRLGICLGIAATFCLGACGDDDSSSDKGKSGSDDNKVAACESSDDCKDVEGKPVCDPDKKECVEKKEDGSGEGSGEGEGGGSGEGETSCASTETQCSDGCFELNTNKDHCGDCDKKCEGDLVCTDGKCVKECEDGLSACGDSCVNFLTDDAHCGNCDTTCDTSAGLSCQAGLCKIKCDPGFELCENDNKCYNLDSDATCGSCAEHKACDATKGEACSNRACASLCTKEGETFCNNECVNFKSNPNNCGGCGEQFKCGDGQVCNNGVCGKECESGKMDCNGNCIDPKTDPNFCGATGACQDYKVCGEGLSCQDGQCKCATATDSICAISQSESICTDPKTDSKYCGCGPAEERGENSAGVNCEALPGIESGSCDNGTCKVTCNETHASCDNNPNTGCEADLTSVNTCGSCDVKCEDPNAKEVKCVRGSDDKYACDFVCNDNMKTCDGKCTDVLNDDNNCGWCGVQCGSDSKCTNGFCVISPDKCDDENYVTTKVENANGSPIDVKAYCIFTKDQFLAMRDAIINRNKYPDNNNTQNAYILMQPIDLGTQTAWKPIGQPDDRRFTSGWFLGNGQLIKGALTITTASNNSVNHSMGLFGDIQSSILHGLNVDIIMTGSTAQNQNIGVLVGRTTGTSAIIHSKIKGDISTSPVGFDAGLVIGSLQSNCTIRRVDASGTVRTNGRSGGLIGCSEGSSTTKVYDATVDANLTISSGSYNYGVGGLIGYIASSSAEIVNSKTSGTISDNGVTLDGVGGLIGRQDVTTVISKSSSSVKLNTSSSNKVGGFVGYANQKLGISDSFSTGDVNCITTSGGFVGGSYTSTITIENSYATGNVNGNAGSGSLGGLVGYIATSGSAIANSHATGNVIDKNKAERVGGLVGYVPQMTIQNSYATGNVEGTVETQNIGGLIGYVAANATIIQTYATGNVKGGKMVGGLIGNLASGQLSYCAATGNIENVSSLVKDGSQAGGLIGSIGTATVANCFATGNVTGKDSLGAVVGIAQGASTIRNVYGTGKVNGKTFVGAFIGKYAGSSGQSLVLKKSYFWEESAANAIGEGSATPTDPSQLPFKYNDDKEAVLSFSPTQKLATQLGDSDWISMECDLKTGPAAKVKIPMLKVFASTLCK